MKIRTVSGRIVTVLVDPEDGDVEIEAALPGTPNSGMTAYMCLSADNARLLRKALKRG